MLPFFLSHCRCYCFRYFFHSFFLLVAVAFDFLFFGIQRHLKGGTGFFCCVFPFFFPVWKAEKRIGIMCEFQKMVDSVQMFTCLPHWAQNRVYQHMIQLSTCNFASDIYLCCVYAVQYPHLHVPHAPIKQICRTTALAKPSWQTNYCSVRKCVCLFCILWKQ